MRLSVDAIAPEFSSANSVALISRVRVFTGFSAYGLAKWLFRRLKFLTTGSDTIVCSPTQFLEKLKEDLVIEIVKLLLRSKINESENLLRHAQVLQLLNFCFRTYFKFDGTMYEQVKGTPMGSPILGFIAESVL
nr:unnamed protein product [Spirometra erinaceieuropaei]